MLLSILTVIIAFKANVVDWHWTLSGEELIEETQMKYRADIYEREMDLLSTWNIVMRAKYPDDFLTNPNCDFGGIDGFDLTLKRDQEYNNLLHDRIVYLDRLKEKYNVPYPNHWSDIKMPLGWTNNILRKDNRRELARMRNEF